ncbi:hypothetical protein [Pelagicoccus sp. SDUM812002]|uniref:hypothetical protein n=1 Tax=Pelagicoccus sp. SDUM812002 TaxID=3041266 RepID=UPI00280FD271|nr:hypothetical protein [Pelagicoccus sp. SDUM812002]MDQ8186679.1 hypothetical protein [Pelagicoccus sp. SDUM812002]
MKSTLLLLTFIAAFFASTAAAEEFTIPFGLAKVPDARLAFSDVYDSPSGDREESIARFTTKDSRQEVIGFYRKALEEAGFQTYSSSDKPDYAMVAAKRDDDRVTIYFRNESDWVEADESEISIKCEYNKE